MSNSALPGLFRSQPKPWPITYRECTPGCRVCRAMAHAAANPGKGRGPKRDVVVIR